MSRETDSGEPGDTVPAGVEQPLHPDHVFDRELLQHAIERLARSRVPRPEPVPRAPRLDLPPALPDGGLGARGALDLLAPGVLDGSAQLHHPGYFAHMDPPTPVVAWAAALWQVAANQNVLHPDVAPTARDLESRVVSWLCPFFGMHGGHIVPGSTLANLTALWAARDLRGVKKVVASERAHLSSRKAADLLGLEYIEVASDDVHRLRTDALPPLEDAALVLTAGTVSTGAIDPLQRPPGAAWLHVDAAWAGPLCLSERHRGALAGIEDADSVGFSAHKWLYQPKGAALVMFRDAKSAHEAMSYGGGYLAAPNVGLIGSAPAAALPLAATLLCWGRSGVAARVDADMDRAQQLAALVDADPRFERWGPVCTGIVVWRPRYSEPAAVRERLTDAWVSITVIDDEPWLRSVAANPSADPAHTFARVAAALNG